ncbi:hypothetical protein E2562_021599 [Oryza meyeriana var. granulata]|uniref:Uncharacterized protein n=1 Tax=Oryza meyeriana var. granulata TaxID=110450 RepID=A0A6G1EBH0_9ORYZ|nr:hypothetical protein E2562_021599 [Oryza meyeriana var. granulata]
MLTTVRLEDESQFLIDIMIISMLTGIDASPDVRSHYFLDNKFNSCTILFLDCTPFLQQQASHRAFSCNTTSFCSTQNCTS